MLDNVVLATTAEFKDMHPKDRVEIFKQFTNRTNLLSGEMLEIMFQAKDYFELGYSTWKEYVEAELPIGLSTSFEKRAEYKKSLRENTENSFLSESKLKAEKINAIEAEIEETEFEPDLLAPSELQAIKDICVPRSHHKSIADATPEEITTIQRRVEESGKKSCWKFYIISDDIFKQFIDKVEQETVDGTKRLNVDLHTIEGLHHVIIKGRKVDQEKWLKDKIREVRKDIVYSSGHKQTKKAEEEAETRRLQALPHEEIIIEGVNITARQVAKIIVKYGFGYKVFRKEVLEEWKKLIAEQENARDIFDISKG